MADSGRMMHEYLKNVLKYRGPEPAINPDADEPASSAHVVGNPGPPRIMDFTEGTMGVGPRIIDTQREIADLGRFHAEDTQKHILHPSGDILQVPEVIGPGEIKANQSVFYKTFKKVSSFFIDSLVVTPAFIVSGLKTRLWEQGKVPYDASHEHDASHPLRRLYTAKHKPGFATKMIDSDGREFQKAREGYTHRMHHVIKPASTTVGRKHTTREKEEFKTSLESIPLLKRRIIAHIKTHIPDLRARRELISAIHNNRPLVASSIIAKLPKNHIDIKAGKSTHQMPILHSGKTGHKGRLERHGEKTAPKTTILGETKSVRISKETKHLSALIDQFTQKIKEQKQRSARSGVKTAKDISRKGKHGMKYKRLLQQKTRKSVATSDRSGGRKHTKLETPEGKIEKTAISKRVILKARQHKKLVSKLDGFEIEEPEVIGAHSESLDII